MTSVRGTTSWDGLTNIRQPLGQKLISQGLEEAGS